MFKLPDLPYAHDALQPTMSAETLHLHHDKHHARYVTVTNQILEGKPDPGALEDVILGAAKAGEKKLFNNAAQAWNHAFFWECMTPAAEAPGGALKSAVDAFGGLEGLRTKFVAEGVAHFGSGWVWLAAGKDGALSVVQTHDGENLLSQPGLTPLLVCDLWEHAYYVDFRNDRESFLKAWFDKLVNWTFAGQQFAAAKGDGATWRYPA